MKKSQSGAWVEDPIHVFFGLSYSAYFVMPRLALAAMPLEWQERFVALMNEADEMDLVTPEYHVIRRDAKGRFIKDPWANYRHGRAADCDPSWEKMEMAMRRFGKDHDRKCLNPLVITCAFWECQNANECQYVKERAEDLK